MDDTKPTWVARQRLYTETGVRTRFTMLSIGIVGVLEKLEQNAAGRMSFGLQY